MLTSSVASQTELALSSLLIKKSLFIIVSWPTAISYIQTYLSFFSLFNNLFIILPSHLALHVPGGKGLCGGAFLRNFIKPG